MEEDRRGNSGTTILILVGLVLLAAAGAAGLWVVARRRAMARRINALLSAPTGLTPPPAGPAPFFQLPSMFELSGSQTLTEPGGATVVRATLVRAGPGSWSELRIENVSVTAHPEIGARLRGAAPTAPIPDSFAVEFDIDRLPPPGDEARVHFTLVHTVNLPGNTVWTEDEILIPISQAPGDVSGTATAR